MEKYVILIPTYNEAETIERIISEIFRQYPEVFIKIIDDNSPDGTANIVHSLSKKYSHLSLLNRPKKEGLGKAYIHGFKEVLKDLEATHLIMMDADMSHDPKYLGEIIEQSKTCDLVIGSRYITGGKTIGWETWRKALSYFGNLYARIILRTGVHDLTGGFNCMSLSKLREINLEAFDSSGYAFQIELKYTFIIHRATFKEVPIIFANRTGGESKISNHIISEGIIAPWKIRK